MTTGLKLRGNDNGQTIYGSALADEIYGEGQNDTLYGFAGNDTLVGGSHVDTLYGGTGNDTFVFNIGDSNTSYGWGETIYENTGEGTDTIRFGEGVTADNLIVWTGSAGELFFRQSATDYFTLYGSYNATTGESEVQNHIERIEFYDSTVWDLTTGLKLRGTSSGETIRGSALGDEIKGNDGGDTLYGYGGTDTLYGGDGNDTLYGGDAADTLSGQGGTDWLEGGAGADVFTFEPASAYSNVDTIADFSLAQNDAIDLRDLLSEYDPLTEVLTEFVQITTSGSNSSVFVDRDGTASTYGLVQVATVQGVTGLTDEDALVSSGHLLVA